eukprot:1046531-Karenia_brevis.AAC.1
MGIEGNHGEDALRSAGTAWSRRFALSIHMNMNDLKVLRTAGKIQLVLVGYQKINKIHFISVSKMNS